MSGHAHDGQMLLLAVIGRGRTRGQLPHDRSMGLILGAVHPAGRRDPAD
jgi:hypothetical protein